MQFDREIWVIGTLRRGEATRTLLHEPQGERADIVPEVRRAS